ncbi:MAG: hypothetical protein ABI556_06450 [Gemmatimonadales bacterium]
MLPTLKTLRNTFSPVSVRLITAMTLAAAMTGAADPLPAQRDGRGDWRLDYNDTQQRIQLTFENFDEHGGRSSTSFPVPLTSLEGLSISQLLGPTTPVRFSLKRDAGTFSFDGRAGSGWGRGVFGFRADPQFRDQLARRGYERPDTDEQFELALHDVGYSLVDELKAQGYRRPSIEGLITMGQHGARFDFIRALAQLGYKLGDTDKLVDLRDHGVTPSFAEGLRDQGHKGLSADDLVNARDHGVTPSFAEGFRQLGYTPSLSDLVRLRDHGVTVEFAKRARDRRGSNLALDELVRMRDRGDSY